MCETMTIKLKDNENNLLDIEDTNMYLIINGQPMALIDGNISVVEMEDVGRYGDYELVSTHSKKSISVYTLQKILNEEIVLIDNKFLEDERNKLKKEMLELAEQQTETKYKKYYLDYKKNCNDMEKTLYDLNIKIKKLENENESLKNVIEIKSDKI